MGRGAGNLRTELMLAYSPRGFSLTSMSDLEREFLQMRQQYGWGTSLPYMISGAADVPQATVMELMVTARFKPSTVVKVLRGQQQLDVQQLPALESLPQVSAMLEQYNGGVMVVGGGPTVEQHHDMVRRDE